MEKNIDLFDRYIDYQLSEQEAADFELRLKTDPQLAEDFRIYLLALEGICKEAHQNDLDFGIAMKNLSEEEIRKIIGRSSRRPFTRRVIKNLAAAAVILIIFAGSLGLVERHSRHAIDNLIVSYNDLPTEATGESIVRGEPNVTSADIPSLEYAYLHADTADLQACEDAGMRLAMAYLRNHDRKKARKLLEEMAERFADDREFSAHCRQLLEQIR